MNKALCIFVAFLLFPSLAFATTPSVVGSVTNIDAPVGSSATVSHTVSVTGTNQCDIVVGCCSAGNNSCITGVTDNGTSMTEIMSVAGAQECGGMVFYLAAPHQGSNSYVLSTPNGGSGAAVIGEIFTLQDCAQSGQPDAVSSDFSSAGATSITPSVTTTATNDYVFGWSAIRTGSSAWTTNGASLTSFTGTGYTDHFISAASSTATTIGSNSVNFSWTTSNHTEAFAIAIAGIASAATPANLGIFNSIWWY